LVACQRTERTPAGTASGSATATTQPTGSAGKGSGSAATATPSNEKDLDSKDILARTETAPEVQVKHVLLAWKDLAGSYGGQLDPRAANRSNEQAATLAQEILAKLKANPDAIDALIKEHSEDPGSLGGDPYTVTPTARMVPEFVKLALRLKVKEAGIVRTQFGYHVMERVTPPPPDPLESADILARPAEAGPVQVQHIMVSWKDAPGARDPRAKARTKADADKLAQELLAKVRAGGDMAKLMKESSEDPNTRPYDVTPATELPFKNLSLRLKVGEAGLQKSPFGWHILKRVPPAPPDPLESADILKREPATQKAKVKHILLGWKDVHAEDKRGIARTRPALEKLVKDTVAKLNKGAKIEPLMKELSEDPGSAASGEGYDVTPDAGLVPPFKNLSLRLKVGEVGVVKTDFGIHIIQRVE
jgi:parvulin-like peptidyl-prolyl isomerase